MRFFSKIVKILLLQSALSNKTSIVTDATIMSRRSDSESNANCDAIMKKICQTKTQPFAISNWIPNFGLHIEVNNGVIATMPLSCKSSLFSENCLRQNDEISERVSEKVLQNKNQQCKQQGQVIANSIQDFMGKEVRALFGKYQNELFIKVKSKEIKAEEAQMRAENYKKTLMELSTQLAGNIQIILNAKLAERYGVGQCAQIAADQVVKYGQAGGKQDVAIITKTDVTGATDFSHTYPVLKNGMLCDYYNNSFFGPFENTIYGSLSEANFKEEIHSYTYIDLDEYREGDKNLFEFLKKYTEYRIHPDKLLKDFSDDDQCLNKDSCSAQP